MLESGLPCLSLMYLQFLGIDLGNELQDILVSLVLGEVIYTKRYAD